MEKVESHVGKKRVLKEAKTSLQINLKESNKMVVSILVDTWGKEMERATDSEQTTKCTYTTQNRILGMEVNEKAEGNQHTKMKKITNTQMPWQAGGMERNQPTGSSRVDCLWKLLCRGSAEGKGHWSQKQWKPRIHLRSLLKHWLTKKKM